MKFPSEKQINRALKILENAPASRPLPSNATKSEALKHELCKQFVIYLQDEEVSQKALARKLRIDPAQMSKILHYHIEFFSVDFLFELVLKIYPKTEIKISKAS